jgi:hypothetical protein
MYSIAARSSSSLQLMQVPFGGMALSPFLTDESMASLPLAIRGAQASLSPSFGAPAFLGGRSFLFRATGAQQHQQYQRRRAKSPVLGCINRHRFLSVMMGLGIHLLRGVRETA